MKLYSYVVRYDSGFAPNPFYGWCTLATCKPDIRKSAALGDWVIGCGSNARHVRQGGHLVYAMRITGALTFNEYDADERFEKKKPYRHGSRKQSCGDNIYFRNSEDTDWIQRDSFHSNSDGSPNADHIRRDTGTDRVLVSNDFVYFGGYGPTFPDELRNCAGFDLCKSGIGRSVFSHPQLLEQFISWIRSFGVSGYQSAPFEWRAARESH